MWLKELKGTRYFHDTYVAHTTVQSDETIALLTYQRILLFDIRKSDVELDILVDQIDSCDSTNEGVQLYIKRPTERTEVLQIEEETSREWFATQVLTTIEQRKEDKERQ